MKRNILSTLTIAAALFALAPAARAGYPTHHQMKKVKYLSHELSKGAHYLYEKSSSYGNRYDRRAKNALHYLHDLSEKAHHFYRQVDHYYGEPRHTEKDFDRLVRAYHRAVEGFHYLAAYDHYRSDFRCLRDTMDDLVGYYGGHGAYGHGYGKYRSYDPRYDRGYPRGRGYKEYRPSKGEKILYYLHHVLDHD